MIPSRNSIVPYIGRKIIGDKFKSGQTDQTVGNRRRVVHIDLGKNKVGGKKTLRFMGVMEHILCERIF